MPLISVIVPVYNEADYIESTLLSIVKQPRTSFEIEVLVVDGGSTDGAIDIINKVKAEYPVIRLLHNKKRIVPSAFNIGISEAKGEYIAILGAHANYDTSYLETCFQELKKHGADACSGRVIMSLKNNSFQSTLIYHMLSSRFGVSAGSYRTIKSGFGEHCPFPVFKKSIFDKVGLYNEKLVRNQDNDMNHRIRLAGYRLYYSFKTTAYYYPKQTFIGVLQYAYKSGVGNAISLKVNPRSMSARHLIPFVFFSAITVGLIGTLLFTLLHMPSVAHLFASIAVIAILAHLGVSTALSTFSMVKNKKLVLLALPLLFFSFHFCYGLGTATGLFRKID